MAQVTKQQLQEVLKGIKDHTEPRIVRIADKIRLYLSTMKDGEVAYLDLS